MTEANLTCSLAQTPEDLQHVYRLRYECYRRDESIPPHDEECFSDRYDQLPNHFSFLARLAGAGPIGTVRISVVRPCTDWHTAPSHAVFGDHPAFQRIARKPFVEASRLCFRQRANRDALLRVVSYMAALADFYEVASLVACPRVEHSPIYEKLFGFERIAEPRQYVGVKFHTTLLAISREALDRYTNGTKSMDEARASALAHLTDAVGRSQAAHA